MSRSVTIRVLVENTAREPGLLAEHGLAYWIEHNGQRLLMDTGQGGVLLGNAHKLGLPMVELDGIVLSHGHYDHTGGLPDAMRSHRPTTVYLHRAALEPKFACKRDGAARDIGIPHAAEQAIQQRAERVVFTEQPESLVGGLAATGPVPRTTDFEDTGGPFFLDRECHRPDPLFDDQAVFFETAEGLVVLVGCAHAGVVNTLRYVQEIAGIKPIHTLLGGMHLGAASPERMNQTIEALRQFGVKRLGPMHCTGMAATAALWSEFPDECFACNVGTTLEFEAL